MDESLEHMKDEEAAFDSLAGDGADTGFDESGSEFGSLIATLDDEIAQGSSSLLSPVDMEAFDPVPGAELENFWPPFTGFDSLVLEIDGATGEATSNIQVSPLATPPDFDSAADAETEFDLSPLDAAEQRRADPSLSDIPFEPERDAMPTFDEMPMFGEQVENDIEMASEQSLVERESFNQTCGVLDSLIAEIDSQVAPRAGEAETQAGSHVFTSASHDAIADDTEQHVIFTLDGASYSFPIASVTEIGRPLALTPLPNVPEWVAGVANLRGDIISVVDLRRFLGLGDQAESGGRMLVVRSRSEEIQTALLVDAVRGIRFFSGGRVQQPTAPVENSVTPYMRGVYEHDQGLVVLLDPEKLMLSPEMHQFEVASAGG